MLSPEALTRSATLSRYASTSPSSNLLVELNGKYIKVLFGIDGASASTISNLILSVEMTLLNAPCPFGHAAPIRSYKLICKLTAIHN